MKRSLCAEGFPIGGAVGREQDGEGEQEKTMQQYLEAGKVVTTHGVRGEMKLELWCDGVAKPPD